MGMPIASGYRGGPGAGPKEGHMEKGIKTATARLRGLSTGRKRAGLVAMLGAVVATVVGLAVRR